MIFRSICSAVLACSVAGLAQAQTDTTQVKRQAELRQSPSDTAASVATLPAQTALTRLPERQGPWLRVKTAAGQTGWIHMFDVGSAAAAVATPSTGNVASGALRGLTNFFSGGASKPTTTTATSTVGIRGLGSEDIANAQPNLGALKNAEALRTDAAQAQGFAADAQLATRTVPPLPAPELPQAEANSPFNKTGGK